MEMTKEEAKKFLEKYITVVGGMKAIDELAKNADENAKAFLKKYMNVVYAGKAIAILAGADDAPEEDGGETQVNENTEETVNENTKESVVEPSGEPVEQ